jgi:hypothetical protein
MTRPGTDPTAARSLLAGLVALAITLALLLTACGGTLRDELVETSPLGSGEAATYEYVIPYGTNVRLEAGQPVDIMPTELEARVGESIRVTNDDDADFMVGPFFVRARSTVGMRFTEPGRLVGTCDMSTSGEIVIDVRG